MLPNQMSAIGVVVSEFNEPVTKKLHDGALAQLEARGVPKDAVSVFWVPGAVEIPLMLQTLARTGRYQALVALGAVIRGETGHYDYVCQQVSEGCQQVSLAHELPIAFGVLTTDNAQQALDRAGGAKGNKGAEAVDVVLRMLELIEQAKREIVD